MKQKIVGKRFILRVNRRIVSPALYTLKTSVEIAGKQSINWSINRAKLRIMFQYLYINKVCIRVGGIMVSIPAFQA